MELKVNVKGSIVSGIYFNSQTIKNALAVVTTCQIALRNFKQNLLQQVPKRKGFHNPQNFYSHKAKKQIESRKSQYSKVAVI